VSIATGSGVTDVDGDSVTYTASGLPAGLTIDASTGAITGTLASSASQGGTGGVYTITVTATDADGAALVRTFDLTVTNPAPVAGDDLFSGDEDQSLSGSVTGNDADPDGDAVTYALVSGPTNGVFTFDAAGGFTFTPDPEWSGVQTFTYRLTDSQGASALATVTLRILPVNDAPIASDDTYVGNEDGPATVLGNVVINDTDLDSDPLAAVPQSGALGSSGGVFSIEATGLVVFDPAGQFDDLAPGQTRTTSTQYTVTDGRGGADIATISVTVVGSNDAPVVLSAIGPRSGLDASAVAPIDVGSLVTDLDASDVVTFTATGLPVGLSIDPVTGVISGVLDGHASVGGPTSDGRYPVTVIATDAHGGTATLAFTFTATNPVPSAVADTYLAGEDDGAAPVGNALSNDADPDSDSLSAVPVVAGVGSNGGRFSIDAAGVVTFDPAGEFTNLAAGEFRATTISYTLVDSDGGRSVASVTVTVAGANDAPELMTGSLISDRAVEDGQTVPPIDIKPAFRDPDASDRLTYTAVGLPPGLALDATTGLITGTIARDASVRSPDGNGTYVVTIVATDGHGATSTISFTFQFSVVNPPPIASDDRASTDRDLPVSIDVLRNDRDPDGDPLRVVAAHSPDGDVTIGADGALTFTPNPGFQGVATIVYAISDGVDTSTASVTVEVGQSTHVNRETVGDPVIERTIELVTEPIEVDGIVTRTVRDVGTLDSIADSLTEDGIVLAAANRVSDLNGIGALSADGVSQRLTEARLWQIERAVETGGSGRSIDAWDAQGLTGFSLRMDLLAGTAGSASQNEVIIESFVRERTLIVQISTTGGVAERTVQEYRITEANGKPLPAWLDRAGPSLLVGQRPVELDHVDLRVTVVYTDGSFEEKAIRIETISGEIKPISLHRESSLPKPFAEQFVRTDTMTLEDAESLARALRR
jgi:VCBS repeat-containing protein